MIDHPPDDVLRSYLDGRLRDPEAGPVEDHVEGCEACAGRLDLLAGGGDTFQGRVRDAAAAVAAVTVEHPGPIVDAGPAGDRSHIDATIGIIVAGRYKVRQAIGEGGMGCVYLADQTTPVRRQVALKLIKPGMDSRTVLARFDSERQALALMDHPHIAKVLDAGTTDRGRPYFVMELVKGVPLTDYCDAHRLDLAARLALFRQICSAVQHAHQKGIIHRDLKPSNILVESHDGRPVPRVIDFGLAKATGGLSLTEQSLYTAFGSVAGTPLYMAPEQAMLDAIDVDTRADIYALGVILYELLTGSTPIRRESLHRAALDEMLRVVREQEPPTPSRRISTSEGLPSIAATRHVEPARLSRLVRGDLDWIVMKALAKERSRRYESATALAQDIERFSNHEPVSAGPPSTRYRVGKFIRRHRLRVFAASLVLLSLVVGIAGTTLGLVEARHQGRAAAEAAIEATRQRRQAEGRLTQIEKNNAILGSIFRDVDPRQAEKDGKPLAAALGERLEKAADQVGGDAIGDPVVVARMQLTLGQSLHSLGHVSRAIDLLSKARSTLAAGLGAGHPDAMTATHQLALAYTADRKPREAVLVGEEALRLRRGTLGPGHPDTLASMNSLADAYREAGRPAEALPLFEQALGMYREGPDPGSPGMLAAMHNLAAAYKAAGRLGEAIPLFEEALRIHKAKLGPIHPDTLHILNNLAAAYRDAGRAAEAVPMLEEALRLRKETLGPDHPDTLAGMNSTAVAYRLAGRVGEAIPILEKALRLREARLGPDHPDTLTTMHNLAAAYRDAGRAAEALPISEKVLALRRAKLGPDHPDTLDSVNSLGFDLLAVGRPADAVPIFEAGLASCRAKLGLDHYVTLAFMSSLANAYKAAGRLGGAIPVYEEALRALRAKPGTEHPGMDTALNNLAVAYQFAGRAAEAVPLHEESLRSKRAKLGPDHPHTLVSMNSLASAYWETGRPEEALTLFRECYAGRKAKLGMDHPNTAYTLAALIECYEKADKPGMALPLYRESAEVVGRKSGIDSPPYAAALGTIAKCLLGLGEYAEAESKLREALAIREARQPDAWTTFNTKSMLGAALLGQGKADQAGPLLLDGYEGMKRRADKIPPQGAPRLAEALDRLIQLAEATDRPDEAIRWREEKARLTSPR